MANGAVSFARDIRPLFRDSDIASMKRVSGLDLSNYAHVSAQADRILSRLETGDMPCDGAWPDHQVQRFKKWIADGKKP
jgi:hypothetical protein